MTDRKTDHPETLSLAADLFDMNVGELQAALLYLAADIAAARYVPEPVKVH